jgi:NAD+ diphosphatase
MEIKFCRRCGATVTQKSASEYGCINGHRLFYQSPPAMGVFLVNDNNEVLLVTRATEPGKGKLDAPGGFCDAGESIEEAAVREMREELHVEPTAYGPLAFLCSGVNDYEFDGEVQHPLDFFFWARVKGEITVQPDDDAAEAGWFAPADVLPDDIAFKTVRAAFEQLKKHLA